MNALDSIGKYLYAYRSMGYKRDKNLMLFGAWFGKKYDDNPKYLFEYVINHRPDLQAVWFTSEQKIFDLLKTKNLPVCMSNSEEAKNYAKLAGYVFTATGKWDIGQSNEQYLGGAYFINLWHGIPLKKIMYDDEYSKKNHHKCKNIIKRLFDYLPYRKNYVVSTSDVITRIYRSAFQTSQNKILQLGQPRNDYFFLEHTSEFKEHYKGKRIILYMPTHRNEGKTPMDVSELFDLRRLNEFCQRKGLVFLIKKHFYHAGEEDLTEEYDSIFDITNDVIETQHLLYTADVLITDYSSCYIDYLLLRRPILFYCYDLEIYKKHDRQLYFEYDTVTPGEHCYDYDALEESLEKLLNGDDSFEVEREKICDLFYDKKAQKSVSEVIIQKILLL